MTSRVRLLSTELWRSGRPTYKHSQRLELAGWTQDRWVVAIVNWLISVTPIKVRMHQMAAHCIVSQHHPTELFCSEPVPDANPDAVYDLLDVMPAFWQNIEAPVEHVLTT